MSDAELPPEVQRRLDESMHRATDRLQRLANRLARLERVRPRILPPGQEAAEARRQASLGRWDAVRQRERGE